MSHPTAELNATPLIDVLLVLLVVLIFSVPLATHIVRLDLPVALPISMPIETINIDVDSDGRVFWNGDTVVSDADLSQRLAETNRWAPTPVVRVWPDKRVPYERVAQVLATAQRENVARLSLSPVKD